MNARRILLLAAVLACLPGLAADDPAPVAAPWSEGCAAVGGTIEEVFGFRPEIREGTFPFWHDERRGCRLAFAKPTAELGQGASPEEALREKLAARGWRDDPRHSADGPGTTVFGLRKGAVLCIISAGAQAWIDDDGEFGVSDTYEFEATCAETDEPPYEPEPPRRSGAVEVIHLANAGCLLRAPGTAVLIDAFIRSPHAPYGAVPAEEFERMVAGRDPFRSIPLALVSHAHPDHFQPEAAAAFLRRHPETLLVSSPEVLDALREGDGGHADPATRLKSVLPEPGEVVQLIHGGARIGFLRLRHSSGSGQGVQNLGHVIEIGGHTILHAGDAELLAEELAAYDLPARRIDVALVPYWVLLSGEGCAVVRDRVAAQTVIAVHIPPAEITETASRLAETCPDVIVLGGPRRSWRFVRM